MAHTLSPIRGPQFAMVFRSRFRSDRKSSYHLLLLLGNHSVSSIIHSKDSVFTCKFQRCCCHNPFDLCPGGHTPPFSSKTLSNECRKQGYEVLLWQGMVLLKGYLTQGEQVLSLREQFEETMKDLHSQYLKSPNHIEFSLSRPWICLSYTEYYSDTINKEMAHYPLSL